MFSADVIDLTLFGTGVVADPEGMRFFVAGVWLGERVRVEVVERRKSYGFARLIEIERASPDRVNPQCPHLGLKSGQCGGCPWMFVDYQEQLRAKDELVQRFLKRAGLVDSDAAFRSICGASQDLGYRNRVQLKTDGNLLGYVSPDTKELAPIDDCIIANENVREKIKKIRQALPRPEWRPKGRFKFNFFDLDDEYDLAGVDETTKGIPSLESRAGIGRVRNAKPDHLPKINERRPFKQGNPEQNLVLKNLLREEIQTFLSANFYQNDQQSPLGSVNEVEVLELFCGSGNFTEVLAEFSQLRVTAVEKDPVSINTFAVVDPQKVKVMNLNLFDKSAMKRLPQEVGGAQLLVLDPPREGFENMAHLVSSLKRLEQIIYISCDLNSFARDVKSLAAEGWQLKTVQPVDMFPHTPHIELFSVLKRRNE